MAEEPSAGEIIERAYLEAAPPHVVYEWFKERAPKESKYESSVSEVVLEALYARNEPLILLALAQFTTERDLLERIYREGNEAVRCAALSNRFFGEIFWSLAPFFTEDEHRDFVETASAPLLEAYLSNPSLAPDVLEALFLRQPPFETIDEERWQEAVLHAASNTRLHRDCEFRRFAYSDGFSAYMHSRPMTAAWKLLDTLPVSSNWASVLRRLYEKMPYLGVPRDIPESSSPREGDEEHDGEWFEREMRESAARTKPIELAFFHDAFAKWRPEEEANLETWNEFGELRRAVAAKAPIRDQAFEALLQDHDDLYVRKGYYQSFEPWQAIEIDAASKRDGKDFIEAAIENPWFYQKGHYAVRRTLYRLVHDEDVLTDATDAEMLRSRYHALGEYWVNQDPQAFEFDEDDLAYGSTEEEDEGRLRRGPSLATVGQRLAEISYTVARKKADPNEVRQSITRLRESMEELQEQYEERLSQTLQVFRERLDHLAQTERTHFQLLLWALVIGFGLLLYFKH